MAACWRCGSETPTGAKFCPGCGIELRSEIADLDVFAEPQSVGGAHVEATDTTPSRWLLVGALALLGGLVGFFVLLDGDEDQPSADPFEDRADFDAIDDTDEDDARAEVEGEELPPATVDVDENAEGEILGALDWRVTLEEGVGFPVGALEIGDSAFVYAVDGREAWIAGGQPRAYRREAGDDGWEDLGPAIDATARVQRVWPADDGALATGTTADGDPTLWRTSDGLTWTAEVLPAMDDLGFNDVVPLGAAQAGDVTVVVGGERSPWAIVNELLDDRYPTFGTEIRIDFGFDGSDTLTVRGPFGIVVDEFTAAEVGIDDGALEASMDPFRPVPVWYDAGDGWQATSSLLPIFGVFSDGERIVGTAQHDLGPELVVFDDGQWQDPLRFGSAWQVQPWGDRFVGAGYSGGVTIFDSEAETIDRFTIPGSPATANISAIAPGDDGIVVMESTWDPSNDPLANERIVVLRDGYTVESEFGELVLSRGDERLLRSSDFWQGDRDRYELDAEDATVTFLSEEGEPLVTFTMRELHDLEQAAFGHDGGQERIRLAYTTDGTTWYGGAFGVDAAGGFFTPWIVGDDIVVTPLTGDGNPWAPNNDSFRFVIAEAPIPD